MPKSRNNSRYLSRPPAVHRPGSYKNHITWQWLQFVTASDDDTGEALRVMRKRVDMTNEWSTKGQLVRYMKKCRIDERVINRVFQHVWNMYREYREAVKRNVGEPITRSRNPWGEKGTPDNPTEPQRNHFDSKWLSR